MPLGRSKLTSQAQVSIPAQIRKKLGVGPGSVLEWEEDGDRVFVRRVGSNSFADIHKAVFHGKTPEARSFEELKKGIRTYIKQRYAGH